MLVGYARVSTDDQHLGLQLDAMAAAGIDGVNVFTEKMSGYRKDRPELDACLRTLRSGDTLVVWRLDRLGRSTRHLLDVVETLKSRGIAFRSLTEGFDTGTPNGQLIFSIFAAMAQFERELLRERTLAGLKASRARGVVGGRKAKLDAEQVRRLNKMMDQGSLSPAEVAKLFSISIASLYRYRGQGKVSTQS